MRPLKPRPPVSIAPFRLRPLYEEREDIGDLRDYQKAVAKCLGIPFAPHDGVHHHVGSFYPAHSPEALNMLASMYPKRIYSYDDFLDAIRNKKSLEREVYAYEKFQEEERHRVDEHESRYSEWRSKDPEKRGQQPYHRPKVGPPMPDPLDQLFIDLYDRDYTPNPEGYMRYLEVIAPDLHHIARFPIPLLIEEDPGKPHGYVLGTPGSGKSELLKTLIHTYVTHKRYGSVVVLDPTSDMVSEIARWREFNTGNRLVYIRPTLAEGVFPAINPFEIHGIAASDYRNYALEVKRVIAQQLVEALGRIATEAGGVVTGNMKDILTNCVLVLLDKEGSTLSDLADFMMPKRSGPLIEFARSLSHHEFCSYYWDKDGFDAPSNTQTKQAIGRRLGGLLNVGTFKRFTCNKSTINLQEAMDSRKVVLFDLGKGAIGDKEGRAIGQLMIALITGIALRRASLPKEKRVPCTLVIDECHNYVIQTMEDILLETRKYGLFLTLAQQIAGQRMPIELRDAVLNAANLQIVGGTPLSGAKRNADLLGVEPEEVRTLETGEFFVRPSRTRGVVRFRARDDLLGNKNGVTKLTWNRIKKQQIRQYYKAPAATEKIIEEGDEDIDIMGQPRS